jgi:hypothetical protein
VRTTARAEVNQIMPAGTVAFEIDLDADERINGSEHIERDHDFTPPLIGTHAPIAAHFVSSSRSLSSAAREIES